jgi:hypothetical protein
MNLTKIGITLLVLFLSGLQAWDSNVLHAGNLVIGLVGVAIIIAAVATMNPSKPQLLVGVGAVSVLLLILARVISPVSLPAFFTIGPVIWIALVVNWQIEQRQKDAKP